MGWPGWARLLLLAAACHGQTQVSLQGAEGEALVDEALVQVDRKRRSKKSESVETEAKTPVPGLATAAQDSCAVLAAQRTDCGFPGISGEECVLTPGCCYLEDTAEGVPWCFHNAGVTVDLLSAAEEASTVAEAGRASKTGPYTDSAGVALDADVARSSKPTAFSSVDIGADAEKWDILDEKGMFEKKTDQKKTEPKTKQEKSTRPEEDQVSTYADKDKAKSKGGDPPASDGAALKPFSWSDPFSSSSVGPSLPAVDDKGSDKGKGQKKGSDASTTLAPVSDKDKTTNSAAKDEAKPVAKDEAKAGKDEALAKAVADMLADEDKKMKTKLEDEKKKEKEEKDKLDAEKKQLREKEEADKKEKERALQQEDEYRKKKEDKAKKEEEEKKRKEENELQRMKKEEEEEEKRLKLREQEQERLQKEEADKKAKEDKEALQKAKEAQTTAKKAKAAAMKAKAADDKLAADKAKVDSAAAPAAASVGTSKPDSNTKMAAGEQPVDKPVPAPAADAPVPSSTKPAADGAVTASKPAADAPVSASKSSAAADQTAAPVLTDPATKDGSSKSKQPESDQGAAATSTKALPDPVDKPTSAAAGRIAVMLRGSSFRDYTEDKNIGFAGNRGSDKGLIAACLESGKEAQMEGQRSVMDKFIEPMEAAGATVDVFIVQTECTGDQAHLNKELVAAYGDRVRSESYTPPNTSQSKTMRALFEEYAKWSGFQKISHDHVFILRNDAKWLKPFSEWKLDLSKINIASDCDVEKASGECYNDVFWMAPGNKFSLLTTNFGKSKCFDEADYPHDSGHQGCRNIEGMRPADVQMAWEWTPKKSVIEDSPYMQWIPKRDVSAQPRRT